jgi:glycosyltransferase involved in cell wall biosynthesis
MVNEANQRPRLLFVSAVAPDITGSGQAMRAGALVRAVARGYRVTLLLTPGRGQQAWPVPSAITSQCDRVVRLPSARELSRWQRFDVVHVFGLDALADAAPWLRWASELQIDLNDPVSLSAQRVATLARAENRVEVAERATATVESARQREDAAIERFDRVFVSSEAGRQGLLRRHGPEMPIAVLPNSLPLPETTPADPPARGPFVLLLVGTVGNAAHDDAVHHFCGSILPRIQAGADRPVTLRVVGAGDSSIVSRLRGQAGVEVIGEVADMAASYRDAHVAVVPLRAGGGSRIRVLEAFARQRPVVSSTVGMAGIAAIDGEHAYIADDSLRFADDVLRLLRDATQASRMADAAFHLFQDQYTEEIVAPSIVAATAFDLAGADSDA